MALKGEGGVTQPDGGGDRGGPSDGPEGRWGGDLRLHRL